MSQDSGSQDSGSKVNPPQEKDGKSSHFIATTSALKLVVSNPDPAWEKSSPPKLDCNNNTASFSAKVRLKGPFLYEMTVKDPSCSLGCSLFLEVLENYRDQGKRVACHFPIISGRDLNDFIAGDGALYDALMIPFQMKVLEQLFRFSAVHGAETLVIFADDDQADDLGVYYDFLTHKDRTLTSNGEQTEMRIPTGQKTFDAWLEFMGRTTRELQQALWREQKSNPTVRRYLKNQGTPILAKEVCHDKNH